jgi:hypothetical protein
MRLAISTLLGAFAIAAQPLTANAFPTGPALPGHEPARGIELVAGGCGPGWHPVRGHFTRGGLGSSTLRAPFLVALIQLVEALV